MAKNEYRSVTEERNTSLTWVAELRQLALHLREGKLMQYLPHALYLVMLGVIYIGNRHHIDRVIREIDAIKLEVEDLRAEYMNAKSAYMYALKRTEMVKKVRVLGLEEHASPPEVIYVEQ